MNRRIICFCVFIVFPAVVLGSHYGQLPNNDWENMEEPSKLNKTTPYCYHFTWMGGKFNKFTFKNIKNKTCAQYFKDKTTLCINPMVATYKGGKPDLDYILKNHPEQATCRLSQGNVCVKYTVYYNGIISYETRYCSIVNIEMERPMQNGCIVEKRGSQLIEVCACESQPGPDGICNSAPCTLNAVNPLLYTLIIYSVSFFLLEF